jgi:hypothetical protein
MAVSSIGLDLCSERYAFDDWKNQNLIFTILKMSESSKRSKEKIFFLPSIVYEPFESLLKCNDHPKPTPPNQYHPHILKYPCLIPRIATCTEGFEISKIFFRV